MILSVPARHIPPPAFLADPALRRILVALPDARIVGGAVRDALAGRSVADIDLATSLPPGRIVDTLQAAGIRAIPTGIDHGTITALVDGTSFEITTLRRDVATDGRHATVAFTDDWRQDAARRDFTINAMSLSLAGEVFDYFGGISDLEAGIVRFVGDPATRIAEDFLRILRFFRFHARYAATDTPPDPGALRAIREGVLGLGILSPERVWSEIFRTLAVTDPGPAVALMAELGVLEAVLPGADPGGLERLIAAGAPADPLLRLAALGGFGELRLSAAERARLLALCQPLLLTPSADDDDIRRALTDGSSDVLTSRTWLSEARPGAPSLAGHGAEPHPSWASLRTRIASMPRPIFGLEGRDALALGLAPGPRVGALLQQVRDWWLQAGCLPNTDACRAELARRVAG